jgi:hypothetical protein
MLAYKIYLYTCQFGDSAISSVPCKDHKIPSDNCEQCNALKQTWHYQKVQKVFQRYEEVYNESQNPNLIYPKNIDKNLILNKEELYDLLVTTNNIHNTPSSGKYYKSLYLRDLLILGGKEINRIYYNKFHAGLSGYYKSRIFLPIGWTKPFIGNYNPSGGPIKDVYAGLMMLYIGQYGQKGKGRYR